MIADTMTSEVVDRIRTLIRFDTSNPPGNELPAARYVAETLAAAGFETEVLDFGANRGSCVARLRGSGAEQPLLLLSHIDVVPAEPDKWTHQPFAAEIAEGYVYGRGAMDMKQATAMHMAVALRVARDHLPLRRDLIVAATCGEEDGGHDQRYNGAHRLTIDRPELIDAEYGLSEGGGWPYLIDGQPFYTCCVGERGGWAVDLVAHGQPGHASVPHPEQALVRLGRALARLGERAFPLHVTPAARAFFEGVSRASAPETSQLLDDLLTPDRSEAALAALPVDDQIRLIFHAMLHNTAVPTILAGGYKSNVIPSEARATLSARGLPGIDQAAMTAELRACVGDEVKFEDRGFRAGFEFPIQTSLFDALATALAHHEPGATMLPTLVPFGTDAKVMDRSTRIIYGFTPMRQRSGPIWFELMHGHDERIAIDDLAFGTAVIYDAVRLLNGLELTQKGRV